MDNLDDSENNAKISDSAYSNSCSNSQSRRSHSSKSTHSGSNSSGSSGYGGKPSTSGSSNNLEKSSKKDKDSKKKKQCKPPEVKEVLQVAVEECRPPDPVPLEEPKEEIKDVIETPMPPLPLPEKAVEMMDVTNTNVSHTDEIVVTTVQTVSTSVNIVSSRTSSSFCSEGFFCVMSMHDGVVMYTTSSLTASLGFPKEMWIGRSFIDFIHPKDRNTFASQITSGLAVPKIVNGTQEQVCVPNNTGSTMVCRIRKYRGLSSGFGVKERVVTFMPFLLKFSFKNISDEEGKYIYLIVQATPFYSAFKTPNEIVANPVPFVMRHAANGNVEYVDPESVPYLGYLPQDLHNTNALQLYHPDDLPYLRYVYENIVKEGNVARSKSYRMVTQNGDYVKVETEWSSFINPWSMKLEFVVGKHHILEGPRNPDVFQTSEPEKITSTCEEEKNKAKALRDTIIKVMNEVLTKPAEVAKQQMSKRCQDLAQFMEILIEEQPKIDEELRLEIQDQDNSYYERDSVMLGGISPHHDSNDSKSSTETPLSYKQLNYNENLQRYFESHQPYSEEENNTGTGENELETVTKSESVNSKCMSPLAHHSGLSNQMNSSCGSGAGLMMGRNTPPVPFTEYHPIRLTEHLLLKHNADMEKELVKMHRETRYTNKGDRERTTESRQKKKEHLARCNASFEPLATTADSPQYHGVKRASKDQDTESRTHKHHCPSPRLSKRKQNSSEPLPHSSAVTVENHCPPNNMNGFFLGVGIPQQMSMVSPVPTMPGMFPMYYAAGAPVPSTSESIIGASSSQAHFRPQPMPCMMYGHPMYGSPFMYSPVNQPVPYPTQQTFMAAQSINYANTLGTSLGLATKNYEEVYKPSLPLRECKSVAAACREKRRGQSMMAQTRMEHSGETSTRALNRCAEAVPQTSISKDIKPKSSNGNSDENVDRTDGESSYSSFYSSFFKTESGSNDDSGDAKKHIKNSMITSKSFLETQQTKKVPQRKMDPPWMEQVCVTSELIYKYQVLTKTKEEVLEADREKMRSLEQPSLVNEQLGQLYMDLQLQGVAARLTLEEGITSSSSSGEETAKPIKRPRRKREYSKLVMIYEEDAPLPPPTDVMDSVASMSTS